MSSIKEARDRKTAEQTAKEQARKLNTPDIGALMDADNKQRETSLIRQKAEILDFIEKIGLGKILEETYVEATGKLPETQLVYKGPIIQGFRALLPYYWTSTSTVKDPILRKHDITGHPDLVHAVDYKIPVPSESGSSCIHIIITSHGDVDIADKNHGNSSINGGYLPAPFFHTFSRRVWESNPDRLRERIGDAFANPIHYEPTSPSPSTR